MPAPKNNSNAAGNSGGKSLQDRILAAEVRSLALGKIKALFELPRVDMSSHDADLHDQILIKLAGTVLPRLTEVTGEGGEPIAVTWLSPSHTSPGNGQKSSTPASSAG